VAARLMTIGLFALPAFAIACGDGDPTGAGTDVDTDGKGFPRLAGSHPPTCAGFSERLRACGLLTEGRFACTDPTDANGTCAFSCITGASCQLLWEAECQAVPSTLDNCIDGCLEFTCADGIFSIPTSGVCNGFPDCFDASDERNCPTFTCGSGEVLPESWKCDGYPDCLDGSDERGCMAFQCGSGETVPLPWQCDFFPDCLDGSDEEGCPGFECGSGEVIPEEWECDGYGDCLDDSDETRCPIFTCISDGRTIPVEWQCDQQHDCLDGSDEFGCAEVLCR